MVSQPDTTILDLTPDMDFLVLASDGLWEEVRVITYHTSYILLVDNVHSLINLVLYI